ncbi:unnamed protein product [Bemisia tabaci]|uniref:AXH domain-containing protein n=1 Tax=Bemisia tabaci TaxID=7038 RepID=A0A9P0CBJ1_BEMTA|nr:unnamed protein product [Bemisia tabaci]
MLSSGLSVEGIGHVLPLHSVGSYPSFLAAHQAHHHHPHPMTFMEPYLKSELRPPVPEFIRPLPKPIVPSTKYNSVLGSPSAARTLHSHPRQHPHPHPHPHAHPHSQGSLINKFHDPGGATGLGPVNLSQSKDSPATPASSSSEPPSSPGYRSMYTGPGLFVPPPPPGIPMYPSIQNPFGSLYPSHYIPLQLSREQNLAPSTVPIEQFPASQPSANSPATAYSPPALPSPCPSSSSTSSSSSSSSSPSTSKPPAPKDLRRPLKAVHGPNSSGREGSLKHRILTRPESKVPKVGSSSMPSSSAAAAPVTPTSTSASTSPSPFSHGGVATAPNFSRGSLIQLANGELKKVEDMQAEDFINSAKKSPELCLDPSTVVRIDESTLTRRGTTILTLSHGNSRNEVELESAMEQPFFVMGHGWASCSPDVTFRKYGLECHKLQVGDVCISLSPRPSEPGPAGASQSQERERDQRRRSKKSPAQGGKSEAQPGQPGKDLGSASKENVACKKRRWSAPDQFCDEEGLPVLGNRPPSQDSGVALHRAHGSRSK